MLYLVHWRWHKFDLSLDAVIKYFAYGFLLTTGISLLFEMLISFFLSIFVFILTLVSLANSDISKPDDLNAYIASFAKTHQWIFILYFFGNAFIVAALVEETAKYFAFWSMEHPDLAEISTPPDRRAAVLQRNRESYGFAITVAMVAAATGFACCEDLGYIFGASSTFQDGM